MSLFQRPAKALGLTLYQQQERHRLILALLEVFGRTYPSITYELIWESFSINAQAWRLGAERRVRVYGGLVRHPIMTKSGLALMLAHETGHHLGGPPNDPALPWLTWQGQADFWAASVGMPTVWGSHARSMTLRGAQEILALHRTFESTADLDEEDISPECRQEIFEAGANGKRIPASAEETYASMLREACE